MHTIADLMKRASYRADRDRWVIDLRHDGRRVKGYGADRRDAANDWLTKTGGTRRGGITFAEYADTWWAVREAEWPHFRTRSTYLRYVTRIKGLIGDRAIADLTVSDLQAVANSTLTASRSAREGIRSKLLQILRAARGDRKLDTPPWLLEDLVTWNMRATRRPKVPTTALPTEDDLDRLLMQLNPRLHIVLTTLFCTGLRIAEVCAVTDDRLSDLRLRVDRQVYPTPLRLAWTKTQVTRTVALQSWYVDRLREHLDIYGHASAPVHAYPGLHHAPAGLRLDGHRLLFTSLQSQAPLTPKAMAWNLANAVQAAGLKDRRITAHKFRHAYLSRLVNSGVPLTVVAKMSGHTSVRMLEQYLHEPDDAETYEHVAAALGDWGRGDSPQLPPNFPPHAAWSE